MNPEGAVRAGEPRGDQANGAYTFAYGLGTVIVVYGLLLCLHPWYPQAAALGSFLIVVMSFVTLSFLITTPESWVPALATGSTDFRISAAAVGW